MEIDRLVGGEEDGEVFGDGGGDGGAEALTDEEDALGRDAGDVEGPGGDGDAVADEGGFGGGAGGEAEAAVVKGEDVDSLGVGGGEGAVGVCSPALGDGAGVAVDCEVGGVRTGRDGGGGGGRDGERGYEQLITKRLEGSDRRWWNARVWVMSAARPGGSLIKRRSSAA